MNKDLILKFAPSIYFDKNEPFFPIAVGATVYEENCKSKSFPRNIVFEDDVTKYIIEYAIYWDFDIQHLYELECIWIYVDENEQVVNCEASFHGRFYKGLLMDKSNLKEETHVMICSQPGKHAFLPKPEMFYLIPDLYIACDQKAGNAGLIITGVGKGRYDTTDEINDMIFRYLQKFSFVPSMEFEEHVLPDDIFMDWEELYEKIPSMLIDKLNEIKEEMDSAHIDTDILLK